VDRLGNEVRSVSKPSGQAKQIAARGNEGTMTVTYPNGYIPDPGIILGRVPEPPAPEPNIAELVARFQIDTEALIESMRKSHQGQIAEQQRKIDHLADNWERTRAEFSELRQRIEAAVHDMNEAVKEALNAQREAVKHAAKASDAAAVFDKLKASQPDFHRMVRDLDLKISGAIDKTTHAMDLIKVVSERLDEFETVAVDYEETKGQVRGIDHIVKNLDADSKQRRRTEIRG
jgi:chromosome segregation ATPase